MCVIAIAKSGVEFSEAHLRECARCNPDGAGLAYPVDGRIRIQRSMNPDAIIKRVLALPVDIPRMAHFRIPSVGGHCAELLHPWPCTRSAKCATDAAKDGVSTTHAAMALAHNGTWGQWRDECLRVVLLRQHVTVPDGEWSDSRAMAWLVATLGANWLSFLPYTQKVATLSLKGLRIHGEWSESKHGVVYSNSSYILPTRIPVNASPYAGGSQSFDLQGYREANRRHSASVARAAKATAAFDTEADNRQTDFRAMQDAEAYYEYWRRIDPTLTRDEFYGGD